jgi:hypothetical protein
MQCVCKNAFSYVIDDGTLAHHGALNGLIKVYLWPCLSYVSINILVGIILVTFLYVSV